MVEYVPTKQHLREVLLFLYNKGETAADSYRELYEIYPDHAPSKATCERWYDRFKSGVFDVRDKDRPGKPKQFDDSDLQALLDADPSQTQDELAVSLGMSQPGISRRRKKMKMTEADGLK